MEVHFGAIEPGLRADLVLVEYGGGDPYDAVLTATDEDILATWISGRVILLSDSLSGYRYANALLRAPAGEAFLNSRAREASRLGVADGTADMLIGPKRCAARTPLSAHPPNCCRGAAKSG